MNDPNRPKLLDRLSALIRREPRDRGELTRLLRSAYARNLLDADALSIIESALTVSEMQVRDVMIPRAQVDFIDIHEPVESFIPKVISTAHSRFPVIDRNRDDVIGVLLAKDLLRYYAGEEEFNVREMLRPAVFVPEAKRLNVLLREFRASRNHMAIVIDEYGGVAGLVTIEDVLEQIVGDIEDEYDFDEASDNILPQPRGRRRHHRRLHHQAPRASAEARRIGGDRGPALPGAARRQPARLYASGRSAQDLKNGARPHFPLLNVVRRKMGSVPIFCFLAGAATVLAFAPFGLHPLAFLSFAFLIHQWISAPPRRCLWLGFCFGLGLFGAGVSWVYVSLHQFGGMPAPIAGFATVAFCAFLALFPAAAGWLQAPVPPAQPVPACLLIPAAWVLFEWLLVWIFTGFPWLALGYTAAGLPLQGYAPLGRVYALSFITVSIAGMLWLIVHHRPVFVLVAILAVGAGEALRHVPWSTPGGGGG